MACVISYRFLRAGLFPRHAAASCAHAWRVLINKRCAAQRRQAPLRRRIPGYADNCPMSCPAAICTPFDSIQSTPCALVHERVRVLIDPSDAMQSMPRVLVWVCVGVWYRSLHLCRGLRGCLSMCSCSQANAPQQSWTDINPRWGPPELGHSYQSTRPGTLLCAPSSASQTRRRWKRRVSGGERSGGNGWRR